MTEKKDKKKIIDTKKAGAWLKSAGKTIKEKSEDVVVWAGEAKEKVAIVADEAGEAGKKIMDNIKQAKLESDFRILRPVFAEQLESESFEIPSMINLCDIDEKRRKSPVCENSIGYQSSPNDVEVLNIFRDQFDLFDISVVPDMGIGAYYVNPCILGSYIAMDKYFTYIEKEKVRELVRIAKDLGAKKVVVEISVKEASAQRIAAKLGIKAGKIKAGADAEKAIKHTSGVSIAANEKWGGHNSPVRPELVYFKNENHIKDLIEMRFDPTNKLESHTYEIEYASSSSIKIKEGLKIDGALKAMKCGISESIAACAEQSERSYFRYTVEFPLQED